VFQGLPPAHVAIALLLIAAILGAGLFAAFKARRRPRPRGIRVDLVHAPADGDPTKGN
jgi:hypothetical protein